MSELLAKLQTIFMQIQYNKRMHPAYLSKLKKLYRKTTDPKHFTRAFISCLVIPLGEGEKHPHVEYTLHFAASFAVSLYSFDSDSVEEEMCPFLKTLFDFLLNNHDVANAALRFRICYFLNMLLNSMGENAFIDDILCDRLITNMLERLLDKVPKVRAQAVFAVHRLQDPGDENCPVIKSFIFHLCKDPHSEVRRAILLTIAKTKHTLAAVLRRTRDISDGVRKLAFQFLTKITVRSLTIEQREQLLKDGFHDRSELVSHYVKTQLLPTWLDHYGGDFIKLLRALDAENALDVSVLMLKVLYKTTPIRNILEHLPVDENTKVIPLDKLCGETVIYWRCTVELLQSEGCQDEVERILPDLSEFCKYIREFLIRINMGNHEAWEKTSLDFVLVQLFELSKTYDLSDEVGRENLKELILDILKSNKDSESLINAVVQRLEAVIPDSESRFYLLAELISELRTPLTTGIVPISEVEERERDMKRARIRVHLLEAEEEQYEAVKNKDFLKADELKKKIRQFNKMIDELSSESPIEEQEEGSILLNDQKTIAKCLQITYTMMQSALTLTPVLRTLMEDMILPSLDHEALNVTILALKSATVACLLDEKLAKLHLPVFFLQFTIESDDLWLAALKGIFDLLMYYGLEHLGMDVNTDATDNSQANRSRRNRSVRLFNHSSDNHMPSASPEPLRSSADSSKNIISIFTGLLDNVNQDLRTTAVEGLAKLLFHRRISSGPLLARLIILWHNPVTSGDAYLRQCLSYFFNHFPIVVADSQEMMERAFLLTLKVLANAPEMSPLQEIDPVKVAQLILHLTRPGITNQPQAYCPHNNLGLAIIAEALNTDSDIDPGVLIRSLRYLKINVEDTSTTKLLQEAVNSLMTEVQITDKRLINVLHQFKNNLQNKPSETVDENDEVSDNEAELLER